MEGFGGPRFVGLDTVVKKRRSARRPRPNAQLTFDACNISPLLSAPSLSNSRNFSADDDGGSETFFRRKEVYLNGPSPRSLAINLAPSRKVTKDGKALQELAIVMQSGSPDTGLGKSGEDFGMDHLGEAHHITSESKLRKVKLKVGGVTRTIHAKSDLQSSSDKSSLAKPLRFLEAPRHHLKLNSQNVFDGYSPIEKGNNFQGDSWMDSSVLNFLHGTKEDFSNKAVQAGLSGKKAEPSSEPTRKSKRVPKRRVFDDVEGDYDIRHTEKLRASKVAADHVAELDESGENGFKRSSISKVSRNRNAAYEVDDEYVLSRSSKEKRKKLRQGRESYDVDYVEEEELGSDVAPDAKRKKQNATLELAADVRTECLTTRQRALQSGKAGNGESLIEFPNGLPPAPSRKQKEKLSEVEIQAKKAEAAQRRKMQVEKQTRESEICRKVFQPLNFPHRMVHRAGKGCQICNITTQHHTVGDGSNWHDRYVC
ncbi:PAPA-1-like conserved region [Musa troglodytarum]|uniref:PAPA-1-like conserved region n=1 Tax=Musa troglodytarum TaxID=320322 RepID=A0A9E7FZI1_9LILI|nr:PAPA-1-like conserved region [Musa troglodytarum]